MKVELTTEEVNTVVLQLKIRYSQLLGNLTHPEIHGMVNEPEVRSELIRISDLITKLQPT